MKRFNVFWLAMVVFSLFILGGAKSGSAQPIKVGIAGPMAFVQGEGHWNGALMAMDEINAKGGIPVGKTRRPIELVKIDTNEFLSLTDAANSIERAISRDRVDFLIGGFRTEAVLAMQDIAMDNKKIFLGAGAAHPELCLRVAKDYGRYKYWFRVTPINSFHLIQANMLMLGMVAERIARELKIPKIKVALIAEKAVWADPFEGILKDNLPKMGMELAGVWRPSPVATDVTAELSAIQRSGAHIIFQVFSASVGIPFAKQWGELKIPAAPVGINVEAQKDGFWAATGGKGNYVMTQNTYARVKMTEFTIPFFDAYMKRFKQAPTYTAGVREAILILASAIEKAGTLDPDKLVSELEKTDMRGAAGRLVFDKNHDVVWGPGFTTSIATQWQDGEDKCVWPWGWEGITYEGSVPYRIPPWMVEHYRK